MRTLGTMALALGAVLLWGGPVQAQGFRGGMLGGGGGYLMLTNASVQEELKLDAAQKEKVTTVVGDSFAKAREKVQDLPDDERRQKGAEIFRATNEEIRAALKDVLKPEQVARLDQISRQQQGVRAFAEPAVQGKLELTEDQKTQLKQISDRLDEQRRELFGEFANDREGTLAKLRALDKQAMEKALGILTDSQKKTWKEMTGAPFEVRFERRPGN